jgi:di/tricarboxylate transporter
LFTLAIGFSTMLLPHQVPPVVVGMQATRLRMGAVLRLGVPLALVSILALLPLQYYWWRLLGAFG